MVLLLDESNEFPPGPAQHDEATKAAVFEGEDWLSRDSQHRLLNWLREQFQQLLFGRFWSFDLAFPQNTNSPAQSS
jgi:hypothetical protein